MTEEDKTYTVDSRFTSFVKYAKYTFLVALVCFWGVSAYFGIKHLWNSNNFFASPWPLIGLVMSGVLIVVVILPLYISIREDIAKTKKEKEELAENNL